MTQQFQSWFYPSKKSAFTRIPGHMYGKAHCNIIHNEENRPYDSISTKFDSSQFCDDGSPCSGYLWGGDQGLGKYRMQAFGRLALS